MVAASSVYLEWIYLNVLIWFGTNNLVHIFIDSFQLCIKTYIKTSFLNITCRLKVASGFFKILISWTSSELKNLKGTLNTFVVVFFLQVSNELS